MGFLQPADSDNSPASLVKLVLRHRQGSLASNRSHHRPPVSQACPRRALRRKRVHPALAHYTLRVRIRPRQHYRVHPICKIWPRRVGATQRVECPRLGIRNT